MAHFYQLQDRMEEVAREYFTLLQAANDFLPREISAIRTVQKVYRAYRVRKSFRHFRGNALQIQRVIRGHLARSRTRTLRLDQARRLNAIFFHHCATTIQKFFRGWRSRRHLHDYYGRQAYLRTVQKRGEYTVSFLEREYQEKLAQSKLAEEENMKKEFDTLAGELHHLISTKNCPGVYNPPYNDALPKAFEKPIEQHLRDALVVKVPSSLRRPPRQRMMVASPTHSDQREAAGVASVGGPPQELAKGRQQFTSRAASVGHMQKIQGPFRSKEQIEVANAKANNVFRSLQSASHFDAVNEHRKMSKRLAKLTRVSPIDFVAPGLPREKPPPSSVHISQPFRHRPMEFRNEYSDLPKIRDKPPFYTALPQNQQFEDYRDDTLVPNGHV